MRRVKTDKPTTKANKGKADNGRATKPESRETILKAAGRLLAKASYAEVTVDEIAEIAGVNKALVYYYFKNKAALIFEVACRAISSNEDFTKPIMESAQSPKEKLENLVHSHVRWRLMNPEIAGITKKDVRSLPQRLQRDYIALRDKYEAMFRQVVGEGIEKGDFRRGNVKLLAAFILGLMNSIDRWYKPRGELSVDQIGAEVWSFISRALEPRAEEAGGDDATLAERHEQGAGAL